MKQQNIALLDGFWDRLDEEVKKQNVSKMQLAEKCGFERKNLNGYYNPSLPIFALLCKDLNVSADYLLFGKRDNIVN